MKRWPQSFNIYLLAAAAVLGGGCNTPGQLSPKKDYATLRVFLESRPGNGTLVHVGHDKIPIYVDTEPFLTEADLSGARLVENADGTAAIHVTFSDHGGLVLDMNTTGNRGKRLVFYSQLRPHQGSKATPEENVVGDETAGLGSLTFSPWLAVLPVRAGITGGSVQFTPDVSHEQAGLIVRGLNNMVSELDKLGN